MLKQTPPRWNLQRMLVELVDGVFRRRPLHWRGMSSVDEIQYMGITIGFFGSIKKTLWIRLIVVNLFHV